MTQYPNHRLPAAKIILAVAVLIVLAVVGYAVWQGRSQPSPAPAESVADAGPMSIEALERKTAANPTDSSAWGMLGLAYFSEGRFAEAAETYDKAARLDPDKAVLWAALGEARVMASKTDPMPAAAVTAFEKAIALDPQDPRSRYFLAVKRDLAGDHEGAIGDWLALLADTPADAPWRADLIRTIDQVGKINKIDVASRIAAAERKAPPAIADAAMPVAARAIPGPSADDLRNASAIPPGQQREMAEGMVSRLEARLQGEPKNVDGWIMLMRSRMTLGEPDKAAAALKAAVAANPGEAARLREQAAMLGVK
jgi:cytochrome c-type biogenesis protein CcmH